MTLQLATLESPMERCGHHLGGVSTNLGGVSTRIASRAHAVEIELLPLKSSSSTSTVALLLVSVAEVGSGTPVYRACSAEHVAQPVGTWIVEAVLIVFWQLSPAPRRHLLIFHCAANRA